MSILKLIEGGTVRYRSTNLDDLQKAAERIMETLGENEQMTLYIVDEHNLPIRFSTNARMVGTYRKQQWTSNDYAILVAEDSFDATDAILNLPLTEIHELSDDSEDTDRIGNMHIDWRGPHSVWLTESVCAYFDVDDLEEIGQAHLDAARAFEKPKGQTVKSVTVTVSLNVSMPDFDNDTERQELLSALIENLDYDFISNTPGAIIQSTEITDC